MVRRAWKFREYFCSILEICQKPGTEVPQNLLELLCSLAEESVVVPSPVMPPDLKCLEAQRDAFRKKVDLFRERLLARRSELITEPNAVRAGVAELKTSLGSSTAHVHCWEKETIQFKAA